MAKAGKGGKSTSQLGTSRGSPTRPPSSPSPLSGSPSKGSPTKGSGGKSNLLSRLQAPTASTKGLAKSPEQQRLADRERRAEEVKRAARDKVAKQQAQLWLMLEHRSVTRLQAAYRGRKGRERMHEQELLRPGVREAVREQERAAIVERHAEQARREQETAGKRQRKAAEAIAREEILALRAQESFLTRNERLKREELELKREELEHAQRLAWWVAGPMRVQIESNVAYLRDRARPCRVTISVASYAEYAAELAAAAATAATASRIEAAPTAGMRSDGFDDDDGDEGRASRAWIPSANETGEWALVSALGRRGEGSGERAEVGWLLPEAEVAEEAAEEAEEEAEVAEEEAEEAEEAEERPRTVEELEARACAERLATIKEELRTVTEQCTLMDQMVHDKMRKPTGAEAYRNRQELARLLEKREKVEKTLEAEQAEHVRLLAEIYQ